MHKNYKLMMMIDEFTDKEQSKKFINGTTIKSIFQTHTILPITICFIVQFIYTTAN